MVHMVSKAWFSKALNQSTFHPSTTQSGLKWNPPYLQVLEVLEYSSTSEKRVRGQGAATAIRRIGGKSAANISTANGFEESDQDEQA